MLLSPSQPAGVCLQARPVASLASGESRSPSKPMSASAGPAKRCSPEQLTALLDGLEQRHVHAPGPAPSPECSEPASKATRRSKLAPVANVYDDAQLYEAELAEAVPNSAPFSQTCPGQSALSYSGYPGLGRLSYIASIDSDTDSASRIREPMPLETVQSRPKSRQASDSSYENEPKPT
ncbi:unnamed protein product [Protopolystoma xenopodis]|uniref:Uncharacterized protein n=1 Tax=Protopolystoma xenopodis TaxID=117903 RepID=A0A3S5AGM0_9PLAT|nr:unnamed protein product [Protopolystoma xenopodis]